MKDPRLVSARAAEDDAGSETAKDTDHTAELPVAPDAAGADDPGVEDGNSTTEQPRVAKLSAVVSENARRLFRL